MQEMLISTEDPSYRKRVPMRIHHIASVFCLKGNRLVIGSR